MGDSVDIVQSLRGLREYLLRSAETISDVTNCSEKTRDALVDQVNVMKQLDEEINKYENIIVQVHEDLRARDRNKPLEREKLIEMWERSVPITMAGKGHHGPVFDEVTKKLMQEDELEVTSETLQKYSRVDAITKKNIETPVINKECGHVYEDSAIRALAKNKKNLSCPIAGCSKNVHINLLEPFPRFFDLVK